MKNVLVLGVEDEAELTAMVTTLGKGATIRTEWAGKDPDFVFAWFGSAGAVTVADIWCLASFHAKGTPLVVGLNNDNPEGELKLFREMTWLPRASATASIEADSALEAIRQFTLGDYEMERGSILGRDPVWRYRHSESEIEKKLLDAFRDSGCYLVDTKSKTLVAEGLEYGLDLHQQVVWNHSRFDFVLVPHGTNGSSTGVVIEADGRAFHAGTADQVAADKARDRAVLLATGSPTIRFTGSEINKDPIGCAEQALEIATRLLSREESVEEPAKMLPESTQQDGATAQ